MNQNNFFDTDGWLKNVNRIESINFNQRPPLTKNFLVVIHSISLPPGQYNNCFIEDFFQNKLDPYEPGLEETQVLRPELANEMRKKAEDLGLLALARLCALCGEA